jgi:hypothetical protein
VTAGAAAVACPRWRATASAVSPASSASVACVRRNAWGGSTGTFASAASHVVVGHVPRPPPPGGPAPRCLRHEQRRITRPALGERQQVRPELVRDQQPARPGPRLGATDPQQPAVVVQIAHVALHELRGARTEQQVRQRDHRAGVGRGVLVAVRLQLPRFIDGQGGLSAPSTLRPTASTSANGFARSMRCFTHQAPQSLATASAF